MTTQEWHKWKENRKLQKRKWKEGKMMKELEHLTQLKAEEVEKKRKLDELQIYKEKHGIQYTLSIALPGSILDNAQSPELRSYLAGQIARAAAIFNVNEIVIFDEMGTEHAKTTEGDYKGVGKGGHGTIQMARILQYLECPQYLRKAFFPKHVDLKFAGLLNPLDAPHHARIDERIAYREGVVLRKPMKGERGSLVDAGLRREVRIDRQLQPGMRVTVRMDDNSAGAGASKHETGSVVAPTVPLTDCGLYWGYSVRIANSLAAVFSESTHPDGYDLLVGTSEKGTDIEGLELMKKFKHLLVVFGGLQGLEASLDADQSLHLDDPTQLFDHYINVCPNQGSSTIRTEEAILITMSALRPMIQHAQNT